MQSKNTNISVILNTFNERSLLEDCLKSINGHTDDVVVTDMGSNDGSATFAKEFGCRVVSISRADIVEETITRKVRLAKSDWILALDPDMRVPEGTWEKLHAIVLEGGCDGAVFHMRNKVFGKWLDVGHGSGCDFYRFFRKEFFLRNGDPKPDIHGMIRNAMEGGVLHFLPRDYPLLHLGYETVAGALYQHLKYAEYEAKALHDAGMRAKLPQTAYLVTRKLGGDFFRRRAWKGGREGMTFSLVVVIMMIQRHIILADLWSHE